MTLFYPSLGFTQCFLSLSWDKYTLLATLFSISCATFAFVLGWKSWERQLATLLGTVDLLMVHSLCESILALACLFLGVYFTVLHTYLFCIASYVRFYFHASGYLAGLSGLVFSGGLGVTEVKGPIHRLWVNALGNLGIEWIMMATGRRSYIAYSCVCAQWRFKWDTIDNTRLCCDGSISRRIWSWVTWLYPDLDYIREWGGKIILTGTGTWWWLWFIWWLFWFLWRF